ncbi:MAG: hypothetical protein ACE5G9_14120, partial [Nitrospinales bacterium]
MKKNKSFLCILAAAMVVWGISASNGFAGIGDGLTDKEKRRLFYQTRTLKEMLDQVSRELKKANVRLQELEATDIENLKQTHAELLSQIETLQKLIPSLQGIIELNQTELTHQIKETSVGLGASLAQVQSNLETQRQQQAEEQEKFRQGVLDDLGQLRRELKGDMESLAKLNQKSFEEFAKVNSRALGEIVASLNEQNQKMAEANSALIALLRTELVPALVKQNKTNLNTLVSKLAESEEKILRTSQTTQSLMTQNFDVADSKTGKIIEFLKQSLEEQKATDQKIASLGKNLAKANGNVIMVGEQIEKFRAGLDKKLATVDQKQTNLLGRAEALHKQGDLMSNNLMAAGRNISRVAKALEVLKNQNNVVVTSLSDLRAEVARSQEITRHAEDNISRQNDVAIKTLETYSVQLGQKLDQSLVKIETGAANDKLAQEKIDKMIDILQTAVDHTAVEEKLDQAILKIETDQANGNLANEKLSKLIEILKTIVAAQGGLEQIQRDQGVIKQALDGLGKQVAEQTRGDQGALEKILADLNRKINVAIARSD